MLHKKTIFIISGSVIFLILIIVMFISIFSKKNYIPYLLSLPLQSSSSFSDMSSLLKNNLKTTITVSDKKQEIDLFLIPSDYTFFITQQDIFFKKNDNSQINKFSKNFYDYEYSSSVKVLTERETIDFTRYKFGRKAQENFILCDKDLCKDNSMKLNDFKFMLVEDPYDKISGGIGLSFTNLFENSEMNFFNELYRKEYINNKIWYINYDKDSDERRLIIGKMPYEIDDRFDKADYTFFKVKDDGWKMEMLNIIIGDDENNQDNYIKEKKFIFNQDSSLIEAPYEYYQKIKQKFFNKYFNSRQCSESIFELQLTEYLYLSCESDISLSDFPLLTIIINNDYKLELTKDDLFSKNGQKIYFLITTNKEERYSQSWYIGEPFLKKYIPVYDQGQTKIGFYKVIYKYKNRYAIFGIIGFIFLLICTALLIYLILYLFKKHRNKKIRTAALEMRMEEISSKLVAKQSENNNTNKI